MLPLLSSSPKSVWNLTHLKPRNELSSIKRWNSSWPAQTLHSCPWSCLVSMLSAGRVNMSYQILCYSIRKDTRFVLLLAKLKIVPRFPVSRKWSFFSLKRGLDLYHRRWQDYKHELGMEQVFCPFSFCRILNGPNVSYLLSLPSFVLI